MGANAVTARDKSDHGNRGFAEDALKSFVERVERRHEERKEISDDVADIYREAKGQGFDVKALREVVRRRAKDPDEAAEQEELVSLYLGVLDKK